MHCNGVLKKDAGATLKINSLYTVTFVFLRVYKDWNTEYSIELLYEVKLFGLPYGHIFCLVCTACN